MTSRPYGTHLALATVSFAVCFMAWGLISAFAPWFRDRFALSATQTAFLIAVPVLLGAVACTFRNRCSESCRYQIPPDASRL